MPVRAGLLATVETPETAVAPATANPSKSSITSKLWLFFYNANFNNMR
jgi:hypothetical protein